ncbi:S-adenosyl-L-methionine-dependent methyltransferase [Rhizoctonia solani]|uniref:S-adenosyl-L-methionine-dependent methyltransferase n=1 Tax=Rhizoctonia solani TaxID=456999 RepID=A0A8H7IIQ7_9AGAM|nr:S-adenosyl-L-methionine-dependent methyltransferase [Rhizoctonia solani]
MGSRMPRFRMFARGYATASSGSPFGAHTMSPFRLFDRNAKRIQKDRAALRDSGERSRTVDYVREEVADRLFERVLDIKRRFPHILDLGAGSGHFTKLLDSDVTDRVTMLDMSLQSLNRDLDSEFPLPPARLHIDEENLLEAIPANSQDAVMSCLGLHWVNDLPGALIQIRESLKPDGVTALQLAQVEREGGISPRVSPMTDTRDVSNLMGRAGFTLLTVDTDDVRVSYPSIWELMEDLRDMGESNAIASRNAFIKRDTLIAADAIYKALHGEENGTVPATFQIIYMVRQAPIGYNDANKAMCYRLDGNQHPTNQSPSKEVRAKRI